MIFPGVLDSIYFYWSICLFSVALVLNSIAILVLLRTSGTIFRDPSVVTLFYILGINLLQLVMVKLFDLHTHSRGQFMFPDQLCRIIRTNGSIFADIGFPAVGIQLACSLRSIRKDRYRYYTWFSLCFGKVSVITLATVLAVLVNTLHNTYHLESDKCLEAREESAELITTIRHSLVLGLPLLFILFVLLALLPSICKSNGKSSNSVNSLQMKSQENLELALPSDVERSLLEGLDQFSGSEAARKLASNSSEAATEANSHHNIAKEDNRRSQSQYLNFSRLELSENDNNHHQAATQLHMSQQLRHNFGAKNAKEHKLARDEEKIDREIAEKCYIDKVDGRDISLLTLLAVSIAVCRAPRVLLHYNKVLGSLEPGGLMYLIEQIMWELPLILIPVAVITIRQSSVSTCCGGGAGSDHSRHDPTAEEVDNHSMEVLFRHNNAQRPPQSDDWSNAGGEDSQLTVSMEGKELENAIFKSRTTTL